MTAEQREKARKRARDWRERNLERARANDRARSKTPARRKQARASYLRNREKRLATMKRNYEQKLEAYKEKARAWVEANPEKRREVANRYDKSARGLLGKRRNEHKRRARKHGVPSESINLQEIFDRDGGICGICGEAADQNDWHLDHVVPLALGGPHRRENVQVAHPKCNLSKGATLPRR